MSALARASESNVIAHVFSGAASDTFSGTITDQLNGPHHFYRVAFREAVASHTNAKLSRQVAPDGSLKIGDRVKGTYETRGGEVIIVSLEPSL